MKRRGSGSGGVKPQKWSWRRLREMQVALTTVLEASLEHARLVDGGVAQSPDRCAVVESYSGLARAYRPVPALHLMWLLQLCEAHQEDGAWAEAAQCAAAVAAVVIEALITNHQSAWTTLHLNRLRRVCSSPLTDPSSPDSSADEDENETNAGANGVDVGEGGVNGNGAGGAGKAGAGGSFLAPTMTMDSAVKYLQMANAFFRKAQLYQFCADLLELVLPVYESRHAYVQLSRCHEALTAVYGEVLSQEGSPIPFKDAGYYRVGFYGHCFGKQDRREFIYRERREVRLGDIMEKLKHIHEQPAGADPITVIPDSRLVDPDTLRPGLGYMQITAVEPVSGSEEDRWMGTGPEPSAAGAPSFSCFMFDTPFTESGKPQGGLEDQWKRRTLLYVGGSFPSIVPRLLVNRSESRNFTPLQNAVAIIESRTRALQMELESQSKVALPRPPGDPNSPELILPRLQTLQRLLQGSVALQVNSGVLGVCLAFLSEVPDGPPQAKDPERLSRSHVEELSGAIRAFVVTCKRAVMLHARAIAEGDREFHFQLVEGLQELHREISHFIPSIR
eukprot:TRINITY_DN7505_c0_g2_i1.p1 TRINITY_DN7505_c0_g2~~TRINITY_DN7505_c0_g2_i1.p1  ORF type:complete len:650 (+),score=124.04 TRINITY_DN7505_c0_g2_i1:269-1951(+)